MATFHKHLFRQTALFTLVLTSLAFLAVNQPIDAQTMTATTTTRTLKFDNTAWHFDSANNVYWQIGIVYVTNPTTTDYESLGIYVPGAYLTAKDNGNGTYTASVNTSGTLAGYTASTAPIVFPVNTPGYAAQASPTAYNYNDVSSYVKAGFVYVAAGMRGRTNGYDSAGKLIYSGGAPWGVTDLKAAIRYYRYNAGILPGDTDHIFAFGMSGGGAQTAVTGATGDSPLYTPYLKSIGAAMTDANGKPLSDAIFGAMAWCPITSLDYADEAYEWNMGQYATTDSRATTSWGSALSQDLALRYAEYINALNLTDASGNALKLTQSSTGIYAAGSYYDYLVGVVQQSLNNFLSDTTFPYTRAANNGFPGGPGGGPGGAPPAGAFPPGGPGAPQSATMAPVSSGTASVGTAATAASTTYQTAQAYIDSLNANGKWVIYNAATNTATITSLAAFVTSQKPATKTVPAFDDMARAKGENNVFSNGKSDALHFDATIAALLAANQAKYAAYSDWKASYPTDYANDLTILDALGNASQVRQNMYNPMYFLLPYYAGYQKSTVATHWRIRTGIDQGDTALNIEVNLTLALQKYSGVKDVDFATVWGLGHVMAERTGDSTTNFIAWVNKIAAQ